MKKFLFTLVAFLMAGSMFADNYFYVEDFEVTPEFLAQTSARDRQIDVAVWAHFDDMVSGWQTNMTLPEGITVRNAEAAEGMTIHGYNALGYPKDYNVALSSNLETMRFIGASTEAGYYYPEGLDPDEDDPLPIGANKWLPGDYKMFIMTLRFAQDFQGGQITFETTASSGQDPRIDSGEYSAPTGETWYAPEELVCDVEIAGATPDPELGGYFVWTQDGNKFNVTYNNTDLEDQGITYTLVVTDANGNVVEPMDGYYSMPDETGSYTYTATVTATGYQPKSEDHTFDYVKPNPAPAPTFAWDAVTFTMTASCEGHNVVLYANGTEVDNPYIVEQTWVEQTINFTAQTLANADETAPSAVVAYAENPVIIPAKDLTASDAATFRMETFDTYVEIYAEGPNVVLFDEYGQEVDPQPYVVARPEYSEEAVALHFTVSATTLNDDTEEVHYKPTTTPYNVTVPVQDAPVAPTVVLPGELKFTAVDMEGTDGGKFTVEYEGEIDGVTVEVTDMIPANRDGVYQLDGYGEWLVKAKATAPGYLPLEDETTFNWVRVDAPAATMSNLATEPDKVTVTVAGSNVALYADPECTEPIDNPYTVARPAYNADADASYNETIYAVTTADGAEPTLTPITFNVPEMLPTPDVRIEIGNVSAWLPDDPNQPETNPIDPAHQENGKSYNAIITVPAEFADNVWYTINDGEPIKWDGKDIPLMGEGNVTVTAWVQVENDKSPEDSDSAVLNNNFTGVNEIANGKTVAGVRYFNMAGQEMQEANGVTIVVTTYTDGTTSAVKVMK